MAFTEGEPSGKHLHEDGVFNWLRKAGGPYLVALNEGEPPGKHSHEDGDFNWLQRARGPHLVAFYEGNHFLNKSTCTATEPPSNANPNPIL